MQIPDPNQPLPSQASYVGFAETQWSLVLTAGSGSPSATDALDRLCATYWPPVFSYLRRQNLSTEDARDLTQEFFAEFTAKNLPGTADQTRGRFRNYLLGALKKSLSHAREKASRQKRGGGAVVISLDAVTDEGKPVLELADAATPEAAYERRWALTVLESGLKRLREDDRKSSDGSLFNSLAPYLWGDKGNKKWADVARELSMAEGTVRVAASRLRQKYREAVREVIRETVIDPAEVDSEMTYLISVLGAS